MRKILLNIIFLEKWIAHVCSWFWFIGVKSNTQRLFSTQSNMIDMLNINNSFCSINGKLLVTVSFLCFNKCYIYIGNAKKTNKQLNVESKIITNLNYQITNLLQLRCTLVRHVFEKNVTKHFWIKWNETKTFYLQKLVESNKKGLK